MSRTIEIIPRVRVGGIPTLDLATKEQSFTSIPNLFQPGETISITYFPESGDTAISAIREELLEEIVIKLEAAKSEGLGLFLTELDGSPPVILDFGDDLEEFVRENYGTFGGIEAEYYVSKVGNINNLGSQNPNDVSYLKLDRIFLSAPPTLAYDRCNYFQPDEKNLLTFDWDGKTQTASCGFQYFYQNFTKNGKRRKFVQVQKQRERPVPDGTKFQCSMRKIRWYCDNNPGGELFENWYLLYKEFIKTKGLDFKNISPIDNSIDIDELVKNIPEIKIVDLSPPNYTKLEKFNSMSIENIVRLCMWMKINLFVFDDIGELMLCYSPTHEYHRQTGDIQKGNVVVKIKDNHGYFVADGDSVKLKFSAGGKHGWGGFYPSDISKEDGGKTINTEKFNTVSDAVIIKHPKARFFGKSDIYDWRCLPENPTRQDYEELKRETLAPYCKEQPPPTPEELIGMMNTDTIYYVGNKSLNGIVNYLQRPKSTCSIEWVDTGDGDRGKWKIVKPKVVGGIKPNNLRGLPTTIHKATYNKLKLYSYHQHPDTYYKYPQGDEELDGELAGNLNLPSVDWMDVEKEAELEKKCIDDWKEKFPVLKQYAIPRPSAIGQAIFNSLNLDCYSRMNLSMRNIFFDSEIKPDFRGFKPTHDFSCGFSLDFTRAYTNALKFMDCEWSVFDAIDEPQLFKEFDENAFYLCEELETGFPYKDLKDKGLALYHGCLLRHLIGIGKVKPIYIINSHKKLPKDYFVSFTEKCIELAGDGENNIITSKQLINQTIGNLKNKGGIKDYKLILNTDKIQAYQRALQGLPVVNINGSSWRNSNYIISKGRYQQYYLTGQPIRLQVIDRINELNLLLDRAVRQSLNRDLQLILVKTDALYYQYPDDCKYSYKDFYWTNFSFKPKRDLDLDTINNQLPDGYEVKIENGGEKPIEIDDKWSDAPSEVGQYPVLKFRRTWRRRNNLDYAWDKDTEIPTMIDRVNKYGGMLFEGEAGTGKTEIIKGIDKICEENREKLELMKEELKDSDDKESIIKEWRKTHPCFIRKLAPTNKACNNIGGKTLHRGLGLKVFDNKEEDEEIEDEDTDTTDRVARLVKILEDKPPDYMTVDEISMISGEGWSVLNYIKQRIPDIKFLLFGDITRQLAPVGEEKRKFGNSICIKELVNYNRTLLKYNFRRGGDSNELWDDWSLHPNRFKIDDKPLTERNISFTNKTRKRVIDLIQENHPDPVMWLDCEVGEDKDNTGCNNRLMLAYDTPLIACKSNKDREIAKNEIWRVDDFEGENIILKFKDRTESFTKAEICKEWLSAYCITIHKCQGDTYDDEYTIWDWKIISRDRSYDGRRLRYVAQSRSTNPKELIRYK